MHSQLIGYLEGNGLLFNNQHGFRSATAVFGTLKTLFENWNLKLYSTCVSKKMRRNINTLTGLGQDRKSSSLKEVKNNEGTIVKDQEAADFMNEFYISAGPNLCSQPGGMKEILNHKLIQISALRS